MTERPGERGDERYDWLFGDRRTPAGAGSERPTDPEPTRVLPVTGSARTTAPYPTVAPTQPYQPPGQPPHQRPDRPAGASPPPRLVPRRRRWPKLVLLAFVAWLVFLIAVPIWAWSNIDKVDAEPSGSRPADTPGTTYLLVGSDSREGLSKTDRQRLGTGDAAGQRTDTMMLLHVPSGGGPTLLLSVPRDSYVNIPGRGMDKINAAFSLGGPDLLVRTVEQSTGLRVDDYIEIGFGGFVDIVDAVGGVQICPKTAIQDPKAKLDIAKGCQQADGPTALGYVRSRQAALGDISRAVRQRQVVGAVAGKAASPMTVLLPWRYVSLAGAGADAVRIGEDVGPLDLLRFAWAVGRVGGNGLTCTVPISNPGAIIGGVSYVIWDEAAAQQTFDAIAEDRTDTIDCSPTGG